MGDENSTATPEEAGIPPQAPELRRAGSRRRPSAAQLRKQEEAAQAAVAPVAAPAPEKVLDLTPPAVPQTAPPPPPPQQEQIPENSQELAEQYRTQAPASPIPPSLRMVGVPTASLPPAGKQQRPTRPQVRREREAWEDEDREPVRGRKGGSRGGSVVTADWFPEELQALAPEGLEGDELVKFCLAALKGRQSAFELRETMALLEEKLQGIFELLAILGERTARILDNSEEGLGPRPVPRRKVVPQEGEALRLGRPGAQRPAPAAPRKPTPARDRQATWEDADAEPTVEADALIRALDQEFSSPDTAAAPGQPPLLTQQDVDETWNFVLTELPLQWRETGVQVAERRLRQWVQPGSLRPSQWKKMLWMDCQQVFEPAAEGDGGSSDGVAFAR